MAVLAGAEVARGKMAATRMACPQHRFLDVANPLDR
jgi:hypothetical protein